MTLEQNDSGDRGARQAFLAPWLRCKANLLPSLPPPCAGLVVLLGLEMGQQKPVGNDTKQKKCYLVLEKVPISSQLAGEELRIPAPCHLTGGTGEAGGQADFLSHLWVFPGRTRCRFCQTSGCFADAAKYGLTQSPLQKHGYLAEAGKASGLNLLFS